MSTAGAQPTDGPQWIARHLRTFQILFLPLLVWYVGSFWFHGDLGKWLDDYGAHVRDPVTGSFEWSKLLRYQWWFFWRPIHVHLVFALQTLFWNREWVNHLFSALMHAAACYGLFKFLRECSIHPAACAIAGLLMLAAPQGFEAIFWPATVSTSIAVAVFFLAARITIRHAQNRHRPPAIWVLAVLGFVTPCLYEQPAAALGALPILYIASAPRGSWMRMLRFLMPCGLGVLLYLALFMWSVRQSPLAREGQFVGAGQLWPRATYIVWVLGYMLDPVSGMGEIWRAGLVEVRGAWAGGLGLAAGSVVGLLCWTIGLTRSSAMNVSVTPHIPTIIRRPVARWGIALFAIVAMILALVPVLVVRGAGLPPRLMYFPVALTLIPLALLFDVAITMFPRGSRLVKSSLAIASALGALAGSVMLMGVQASMHRRSERDLAEIASLRTFVPNPPPGTLFMPIRIVPNPADPHSDRLQGSFQSIWESPWAVNTHIKHIYGRSDVNACALYKFNQSSAIVRLGDPTSISWGHYVWHLPTPRAERTCPDFAQDHIVPFIVDGAGRVILVDRVTSVHPDGSPAALDFPLAQQAAANGAPTRQVPLAVPIANGHPWLEEWTWPHRKNDRVVFLRLSSWGSSDRAVRMHPPTPGIQIDDPDTDAMSSTFPAGPARRLIFYATCDEATIDLSTLGDGVELVWTLAGSEAGPNTVVLHRDTLDPKAIKAARSWKTVVIDLPESDRPRTLTLSVGPGPRADSSYDRIIVTCGEDATTDRAPGPKQVKD